MNHLQSTVPAISFAFLLAPLTAQVSAHGGVFLGGAQVSTASGTDSVPAGTPIHPVLDLVSRSNAYGASTFAQLKAEVYSNGFDLSARDQSFAFAAGSVKANLSFGITATRETSGHLLVEMSGTVRPGFSITSSSIGSVSFPGPETRYSIPMTVGPGIFQDIRMFVFIDHRAGPVGSYSSRSTSLRVRFQPIVNYPRCDISPYGRSCASLSGSHNPVFRRINLSLRSDLPNQYGQVLIGRRPQNIPLNFLGCFQLIEPDFSLPTITFRTDRLGNSAHSILAPPLGTTIYVQDVVGDGRVTGRSTNGLKISCR